MYKNFRNFVLQNFPFLEDDFDALTDYQLFCKMMAYVKQFAKDNEEFKKRLDELQPYVNNKLDEMAQDGTLAEIINEEIFNDLNDKIGDLSDLETTDKSSVVDAINEVVTRTTNHKYLYGIIRPSANGWVILNNSDHSPVNLDSVAIVDNNLIITHNHNFTKVNSFQITPDETFSRYGITVGASVGLNSSRIDIFQHLNTSAYIRTNSGEPSILTTYSNLVESATFNTNHITVTFNQNLTGCIPTNWTAEFTGSATASTAIANKSKKLQAIFASNRSIEVYCLLDDGTFSTDVTDFDRIIVRMSYDRNISPQALVDNPISGANFWIEGIFE